MLKQGFLAVQHDFHWFWQPNFFPLIVSSRSRKFWKGRSRIFYLRLRNPARNTVQQKRTQAKCLWNSWSLANVSWPSILEAKIKIKPCFTLHWTAGFTCRTFTQSLLSSSIKRFYYFVVIMFQYFFPRNMLTFTHSRFWFAAGLRKIGSVCYKFFKCLMAALKENAAVKTGMQYGKRITDAMF